MSDNIINNLINIGNVVNDGLGDDLRTAFEKVNDNFREISETIIADGINLGSGAKIFKQKDVADFEFRSLVAGENILITEQENEIQISGNLPAFFKRIETESGTLNASGLTVPGSFQLAGEPGGDVFIRSIADSIYVDTIKINNRKISDILSSFDFGPIAGQYDNAIQFVVSNSNIDFGTIDEPSGVFLDEGIIVNQGIL